MSERHNVFTSYGHVIERHQQRADRRQHAVLFGKHVRSSLSSVPNVSDRGNFLLCFFLGSQVLQPAHIQNDISKKSLGKKLSGVTMLAAGQSALKIFYRLLQNCGLLDVCEL